MDKIKLIALLLCASACGSQTQKGGTDKTETEFEQITEVVDTVTITETENNQTTMKKFDIERFNSNQNLGRYNFTDEQRWNVEQVSSWIQETLSYEYYEYITRQNSPYEHFNWYDANGNITMSNARFYGMLIGINQVYDRYGRAHDGENFDAPFKFSLENLIEKMNKEYKINLLDTKKIRSVVRGVQSKLQNTPTYSVSVRDESDPFLLVHVYLIDGNTGKTLFVTTRETEWYPGASEESVVDEYIRTKK